MSLFEQLKALTTEQINLQTQDLDLVGTSEIMVQLNREDQTVPLAVAAEIPFITGVVDAVVEVLKAGGRLIYVGAGTSGRLGVVDASEMPPTFGTHPSMVHGIIAGGPEAMFAAVEGAEDSAENGMATVMHEIQESKRCVVVGISASGRAPFVLGALEWARKNGHVTVLLSTNPREVVKAIVPQVDHLICPNVGAEPIAGSTRMKSGTAQKLVLNMISTASMVKLGKTYGNVMVDLKLSNQKLVERAKKIIMMLGDTTYEQAEVLLTESGSNVKTAIVMSKKQCSKEQAEQILLNAGGFVRIALNSDN